jgi:hypothetical protein
VPSHDARADGNPSLRAHDVNVQVRSRQEPRRPFDEDTQRRHVDDGQLPSGAQAHTRERRERIRDMSRRAPPLRCPETRIPTY